MENLRKRRCTIDGAHLGSVEDIGSGWRGSDICDCTSVQWGSLGNGACEDSGCKGSKMKAKSEYFLNTLFWLKIRGSIYSSREINGSVTTVEQAKDDAGLNQLCRYRGLERKN